MKNTSSKQKSPSSFRDPSGFIFLYDNCLFRQINQSYKKDYDHFMESGLYHALLNKDLIISHQEINQDKISHPEAYKTIKPKKIPFISYPYEWCFSQLKDAALTTLKIQKLALEYKMFLKDSSAYNIQFFNGKPILIDTLSFEIYKEGMPWVAYKQFCQHFLAPLALISYKDARLIQLLRTFLDGIPLDLASKLLPKKALLHPSILAHIYFHAKAQNHYSDKSISKNIHSFKKISLLALIDNLETLINKMSWKVANTEWGDYYNNTNYSNTALLDKKSIIEDFLKIAKPNYLWDLGANIGTFSRVASEKNIKTVSFDIDIAAVEKNYILTKKNNEKNILPLFLDLTNPSPSIGWAHSERMSLENRGPVDLIMALALIHHLAISNNLPFDIIAKYFSKICSSLIIEFIPKKDSNVQKLLATREDIFSNYTQKSFEDDFKKYFRIIKTYQVKESKRILYLMKKV